MNRQREYMRDEKHLQIILSNVLLQKEVQSKLSKRFRKKQLSPLSETIFWHIIRERGLSNLHS